jgi:hypothetical protein
MLKINLETFSLNQLPETEDDFFEFKSSSIVFNESGELKKNLKELKNKLTYAVSGFANSGGGCFVVGVDRNGNADNGLPLKIERQDLRDWVDQIIEVEPVPQYEIKLIQDSEGRGVIKPDSAVLIVVVHESYVGPHRDLLDNHYYIRAGAHTVRAKHFIVDAIWAKRHFSKPRLTHLFRLKPDQQGIIQLGILTLTSSPAVDVKISLSPFPDLKKNCFELFPIHLFPLNLSVIDQNNPFFLDVGIYSKENFENDIYIEIDYCDLAGNHYRYRTKLVVEGLLPRIRILGSDNVAKIVTQLKKIDESLKEMTSSRETISKPNIVLPKPTEKAFFKLEKMIPELLASMKEDLLEYPFAREFIIMYKGNTYNGDENNLILYYYYEDHSFLRHKLRLLENHQLIYEITYNSAPRFVMSEELANYLLDSQLE